MTDVVDLAVLSGLSCRTVLRAGANEIIVRDRTPAPLGGGPSDSLYDDDNDDDVHPFVRRRCPHELWLALDLDSYLEEKREDDKTWKWKGYHYHHYDRFTLRVSWPASVSFTHSFKNKKKGDERTTL